MAQKIKKGDTVIVLAGKDKGKTGSVLEVMPKENRAIVKGVMMVKRHRKPTQTAPGGIVEKEATIHISNIAYMQDGKATRVGFKIEKDAKVRYAKSSGAVISGVK